MSLEATFLVILAVAIAITLFLNKSQKIEISETTYYDTDETGTRTVQKIRCPACGNKDMNFQMVGNIGVTYQHTKNISTTGIYNKQHAICNKCGHHFDVIRKTTPVINFLVGIACAPLLYAIVQIAIGVIGIMLK